MNYTPQYKPRSLAKTSGLFYLLIFAFSITSNFLIFDQLLLNDTAVSLQNINSHSSLFRTGIALWVCVMVFDTIVAWLFYHLFKPVDPQLSQLSTIFRIIFVCIFSYSLIADFALLKLASVSSNSTDKIVLGQMLRACAYGAVRISFVFFGLHILTIALLTRKSKMFHRPTPYLLILAAVGYLADSFLNFLSREYEQNENAFILVAGLPALVAEMTLTLELIFKVAKPGSGKSETTV